MHAITAVLRLGAGVKNLQLMNIHIAEVDLIPLT